MAYLSRRTRFFSAVPPLCTLTLLSGFTLMITGCGNFFNCENKPACPTTGTGGSSTGPVLTALVNSPYAAPAGVNGLAIDSTGAYLSAAGYDLKAGLQLYSIGTAGALTASATAGTGASTSTLTAIPTAIAATTAVTGTVSSSADYVYVANSATGPTTLNGYNLANGTLAAATNAPFSLGPNAVPSALAITPANTFLYLATDGNATTPVGLGNIYGYSITTGGALSILTGGSPLLTENDAALAISPDGQWLFTLASAGLINEYPINSTTGALGTLSASYPLISAPAGSLTPFSLAFAPSGQFFAAALGTGGANVHSFTTSTGLGSTTPVTINPGNASTGIYAVAFDKNNNLYCVGTAGLQVFSVTSAGVVTLLKTYPTGAGAHSIVINSTSTAVYVGNETDGNITGYSIAFN